MTIDEFARATSTTVRNVRAYHERGLLPPPRMVGRTGRYDEAHVERMLMIQRLQADGFSLAAIAAVLDAWLAGQTLDDLVGRQHVRPSATNAVDVSSLYPATKFRIPAVRMEHVDRSRCVRRHGLDGRRHVLITAPGGSGKSTLAQQLLSAAEGPTAWLALDGSDDGLAQFWTAVVVSLRTALADFGDDLLTELAGGREVAEVVVALADRLRELSPGVTLVVDDLHEIADSDVLRLLGWFLDDVAATDCGLILCSRTQPQLATGRLTVGGKLVCLQTEDLGFDDAEAAELLGRLDVSVTEAEVRRLVTSTDGWPSGLYLLGLAMRGGASADSVLSRLLRPGRQLHDFFAQEVVAELAPEQLDFLEDISVLDRFNADLCDYVCGRDDSAEMLDRLRDNMFLLPLDDVGYWMRLHQTFAAVLKARRVTASQADVTSRHLRAGRWHEQRGAVPEAIKHYLAADATDDAARLIGECYPRYLNISSHGGVVDGWLQKLPEALVANSPKLGLAAAGVAGLRGDRSRLQRHLQRVEALVSPTAGAQRSTIGFMRGCFHFGDVEAGLRHARSAYAASTSDDAWYPMQGASAALLCSWLEGPSDEVLHIAEDVCATKGVEDQPIALVGAWALVGYVLAARGDAAAPAAIRRAAELRTQYRLGRVPQAANTWSSTARARRLVGDVDAAVEDARNGYTVVSMLPPDRDATGCVVPLLIELVHGLRLQGRLTEARAHADEARRRLVEVGAGLLPAMLEQACEGLEV